VVNTLSDMLNMSAPDIRDAIKSDKQYVLLKRPISAALGDQIKALEKDGKLNLSGIDLTPIPHRMYPGGSVAAQLLGFVAIQPRRPAGGLLWGGRLLQRPAGRPVGARH
jgi:cell division protein FtsI/penicillin-binding protein 2